jgi:hypothetical protein
VLDCEPDVQIVRPLHIILHHHDQHQAPGGHFHGTPLRGIEIGNELIIVECAELGTQM